MSPAITRPGCARPRETREIVDRLHGEMQAVVNGESDKTNNPLKHAPHTAEALLKTEWNHAYSREAAAYPVASLRRWWPGARASVCGA